MDGFSGCLEHKDLAADISAECFEQRIFVIKVQRSQLLLHSE